MRAWSLISLGAFLVGCGSSTSSYVKSDTTLGRIVVYRNGVAYFERSAAVSGDSLRMAVPADKVDDFLKSLTVVDAKTGEPAPVSYPSVGGDGTLEMKVNLPGSGSHEVKLTYVTESPAWKPSYRIVLDKANKVNFQAWAIVDNTSGEDWQNVKLGVGSSSAMSFRFNLRDIRSVNRQTLQATDLFVQAPPTGGATYDQRSPGQRVFGDFSDSAIANNEAVAKQQAAPKPTSLAMRTTESAPARKKAISDGRGRAAAPSMAEGHGGLGIAADTVGPPPPPMDREQQQFVNTVNALRGNSNQVVVEGFATPSDKDKQTSSLERANKVRDQLVRNGLDPNRVVAVGRGEQAGRQGGVRIMDAPQVPAQTPNGGKDAKADDASPTDPIGTSHFESGQAMSVPKGSSAMVSIYKGPTDGEVVYLYDAESSRGNASFPFKAVRLQNPTESQLEQGPVTVYGQGRFIGEGLTEPIPAKSMAFVPFALDRQIVVEKKDNEREEIARVITVQRGVFSAEIKHTRKRTLTLHNRGSEHATVYLRHTVAPGFKLTQAPKVSEKLGNAQLFKVELEPSAKAEVTIEEATPIYKTTDVRSPEGLEKVKAFLSSAAVTGKLKEQFSEIVKLQQDIGTIEQRIATQREQMSEYRARMDELHAQIVTLRAVKTAGPIMGNLEKKLQEVSERVSKATVDVVALEEKLMVTRIKMQDSIADLSLEKSEEKKS